MFNKLMLLLPFALFTSAWKFYEPHSKNQAYDPTHPMSSTYLREDVLVKVRLHRTHLHAQDALALRRQRREHVALEPAQHEGLKLLVQLLDLHLVIRVREVELVRELDCSRRRDQTKRGQLTS